jgi:hypothetical protein
MLHWDDLARATAPLLISFARERRAGRVPKFGVWCGIWRSAGRIDWQRPQLPAPCHFAAWTRPCLCAEDVRVIACDWERRLLRCHAFGGWVRRLAWMKANCGAPRCCRCFRGLHLRQVNSGLNEEQDMRSLAAWNHPV